MDPERTSNLAVVDLFLSPFVDLRPPGSEIVATRVAVASIRRPSSDHVATSPDATLVLTDRDDRRDSPLLLTDRNRHRRATGPRSARYGALPAAPTGNIVLPSLE